MHTGQDNLRAWNRRIANQPPYLFLHRKQFTSIPSIGARMAQKHAPYFSHATQIPQQANESGACAKMVKINLKARPTADTSCVNVPADKAPHTPVGQRRVPFIFVFAPKLLLMERYRYSRGVTLLVISVIYCTEYFGVLDAGHQAI
jgi:hypothetical protein